MTSFFGELQRRSVVKVAVAYAIVSWLIVQIIVSIEQPLNLPDWTDTLVIVLLAVGFIVAVILAWAYELTPDGVKKTMPLPLSGTISQVGGRKLDFLIIGALALALAFVVVDQYVLEESASLSPENRRSIAVLPFENRSARLDDRYFVDGIHDDILTHLARIESIRVISRTSVMGYRDTDKNMRTIGEELDVATVLEGGVQRAGENVRINVQLIDTATDESLWAGSYDRDLNAENVFAIQSEMATAIAGALQASLSPRDVARLSDVPTQNTRALDFYLSGNGYFNEPDDRTYKPLAIEMYTAAVREDPEFAHAWAALSRSHTTMYWFVDPTPARLALAEEAAQRALTLAPDLPETHIALGHLYDMGYRTYDRALTEYAVAEAALPGDPYVYERAAYTYRRMGDFESAAARLERVLEQDPRNLDLLEQLANTLSHLRRYDAAEQYLDRALELAPDFTGAPMLRAWNAWRGDGDVSLLRQVVADPSIDAEGADDYFLWAAALYERDYDTALDSLDDWETDAFSEQYLYSPRSLFAGFAHQLAGRDDLAAADYRAARDQAQTQIEANPEDPRLHVALAQALAGLGEIDAAEASARRAMEIMPRSRDDLSGGWHQREAVIGVFARTGNVEAVVMELDDFLTRASAWSIEGLLPDPRLDPVRDDPEFQALVAKYWRQ